MRSSAIEYRPDIDGIRAVAILAVVGFHASPEFVTGGFVGVDVFFVISGYLISNILLDLLQRDKFSLIDFYSHRARRIFPALSLVLAVCLIFGWFVLFANEYRQLGSHTTAGPCFMPILLFGTRLDILTSDPT
jgi:peptidoglycan/LPS O-acetylase OafA/YrhL